MSDATTVIAMAPRLIIRGGLATAGLLATGVQTDVHIVPVDSDSPIRNLLKVQTVRCALVLYKGN